MKRITLMSVACLALYFVWGGSVALGQEPEQVLAGEIDIYDGKVRFTGGTLIRTDPSTSFRNYSAAKRDLRNRGVSMKALDDLDRTLRASIKTLERSERRNFRTGETPTTSQYFRRYSDKEISLIRVNKKSSGIYEFQVFTGSESDIVRATDPDDKCERLNDQCFICPDNTIRCRITAVKGGSGFNSRQRFKGGGFPKD